jgi:hypothetical protein
MPEFEEGIDDAKLHANPGTMRLDDVELYLSESLLHVPKSTIVAIYHVHLNGRDAATAPGAAA